MKNIKGKFIVLIIAIFAISVFISCEKAENNYTKDESSKTEIINTRDVLAPPGGILIRNKFKWAIRLNPVNCEDGRGLCISGFHYPDHNTTYYNGILYKSPESEDQIVFYFPSEYIEAEDELIVDGYFVIEEDLEIDEEMSNYVGFEYSITIKSGNYLIVQDEAGWYTVTANIEY